MTAEDGRPIPQVAHVQRDCPDRAWCLCVGFCYQAYLRRPSCRDRADCLPGPLTAVCHVCGQVYLKSEGHDCQGPPRRA